jgi:hypothetical protein
MLDEWGEPGGKREDVVLAVFLIHSFHHLCEIFSYGRVVAVVKHLTKFMMSAFGVVPSGAAVLENA